MIRNLILFSLRFPVVVLALAVVMLAAGGIQLHRARWDVFPEFAPPQVVVQTEAPGLSADEVEQLVALPVEAALAGVSRIQVLRSSSVQGLCVATAIFEEGTNVLVARQLVAERLSEVRSALPDTAENPRLMPLTSSTSRLLMIGLTPGRQQSREQLRTFCDWTLRRRLQAVPGVAHVEVFGGEVKQYQIAVSPLRSQEHGVTLEEVVAAGRQATGFGGAGFVETANQRLSIRQRTRIERPEDLGAAPVAVRDGVSLTLDKVADVRVAAADRVGSSTINGEPGVLLVVHKQPDFNTLTVTSAVQRALNELKDSLPPGTTLHPLLFRQATFIERAIGNLSRSLLFGCGLVTLVLVAFLMNWRVLLISLAAIPLSLMGAILVLLGAGVSLNAMTLGGLAIALGEVVDDAIVDVENVLRRLHENARLPNPRPRFDVVLSASLEVRSAVVFASFIVMLVFLPVFFLEGLAGKLFGPLGLAYVVAILVSLGVALTVTPALCLLMLTDRATRSEHEPWLVRQSNRLYRGTLPFFLHRPRLVIGFGLLTLVASGAFAANSPAYSKWYPAGSRTPAVSLERISPMTVSTSRPSVLQVTSSRRRPCSRLIMLGVSDSEIQTSLMFGPHVSSDRSARPICCATVCTPSIRSSSAASFWPTRSLSTSELSGLPAMNTTKFDSRKSGSSSPPRNGRQAQDPDWCLQGHEEAGWARRGETQSDLAASRKPVGLTGNTDGLGEITRSCRRWRADDQPRNERLLSDEIANRTANGHPPNFIEFEKAICPPAARDRRLYPMACQMPVIRTSWVSSPVCWIIKVVYARVDPLRLSRNKDCSKFGNGGRILRANGRDEGATSCVQGSVVGW